MKKKNWSKRQQRLLIKFNREYLSIQWNKKSKVLSGSSNATSTIIATRISGHYLYFIICLH